MVKPSCCPIIVWSIHPRARLLQRQLRFRTSSLTDPPAEQEVLSKSPIVCCCCLLVCTNQPLIQILSRSRCSSHLLATCQPREHGTTEVRTKHHQDVWRAQRAQKRRAVLSGLEPRLKFATAYRWSAVVAGRRQSTFIL